MQTTNDEALARTLEVQDSSKQHRAEQLHFSTLLERFPHYVMVLEAKELTIQSINPGYRELFGGSEVIGLTISEAFSGRQLDALIKLLKRVAKDGQPITSEPMNAVVEGTGTFVHTIVPIADIATGRVERLFIYSERME